MYSVLMDQEQNHPFIHTLSTHRGYFHGPEQSFYIYFLTHPWGDNFKVQGDESLLVAKASLEGIMFKHKEH